jgi:hypothetical protein
LSRAHTPFAANGLRKSFTIQEIHQFRHQLAVRADIDDGMLRALRSA